MNLPNDQVITGNDRVAVSALPAEDHPVAWKRPGRSLLLWWVLAHATGAVVGLYAADTVFGGVFRDCFSCGTTAETLWSHTSSGLILGAVIGFVEWLVLRVYIPHIYWWIPATALGWGLGPAARYLIDQPLGLHPDFYPTPIRWQEIVWIIALSTIVSLFQSVILAQHIRQAGYWVLANIAVFGIIFLTEERVWGALYSIFGDSRNPLGIPERLVSLFWAIWLLGVSGLTTGLTLTWLLARRPRAKQEI